VWHLRKGQIEEMTWHPADAGLPVHPLSAMRGGDPAHNLAQLHSVLANAPGPLQDWVRPPSLNVYEMPRVCVCVCVRVFVHVRICVSVSE
jgi:hypothetical protein